MTQDGQQVVLLSGTVDFARRRDSISLSPGPGMNTYPPFEVRFVGGWTYIEIDEAVRRPPTLHPGTAWIAFHQRPAVVLPVPDRALPPQVPIDVINLPLTQPMVDARFIDGPEAEPERVSVRFAKGEYSGIGYTYSIDADQHIVRVSGQDVARGGGGGSTLEFAYGPRAGQIAAPSTGVQRIAPGETLYPQPTTTGPS